MWQTIFGSWNARGKSATHGLDNESRSSQGPITSNHQAGDLATPHGTRTLSDARGSTATHGLDNESSLSQDPVTSNRQADDSVAPHGTRTLSDARGSSTTHDIDNEFRSTHDPFTANRQVDDSATPHGTRNLSDAELRSFLQNASPEDITLPSVLSVIRAPPVSRSSLVDAYRDEQWLYNIFGRTEEKLVSIYAQNEVLRSKPPPAFTVGTIDGLFRRERAKDAWWASSSDTEHWPRVRIVQGLDALLLPSARAAADGFIQVFSLSLSLLSNSKSDKSEICFEYIFY